MNYEFLAIPLSFSWHYSDLSKVLAYLHFRLIILFSAFNTPISSGGPYLLFIVFFSLHLQPFLFQLSLWIHNRDKVKLASHCVGGIYLNHSLRKALNNNNFVSGIFENFDRSSILDGATTVKLFCKLG